MPTPEERAYVELRLADLKLRMQNLDRRHYPEDIAEWAALYEVREALEKQLGNDQGP